jgi:hypothetical protein
LETRHVRDAFKAMPVKTDRTDARGIAQLMRLGWFRPVHCKSLMSATQSWLGRFAAKLRSTRSGAGIRIAIAPCGNDAMTSANANNARCPHQPGHPLFPNCTALGTQLCMDTWFAIRAARNGMDRAHPLEQRVIGSRACRWRTRTPRTVIGGRHAEHACHGSDGKEGLVRALPQAKSHR